MTNKEAIKNIKEHCYFANLIPKAKEALDMAIKVLEQTRWIPIIERPLTDEERKEYGAEIGFMYDCVLPEDSQDVLISTPYGVRQTTFYKDYGCYFENYEDEGDVVAWMPLPESYKCRKRGRNDKRRYK